MSSLDKFPDWEESFRERPIPFEVRLQSPSSEIKATLERYSAALNAERQAKEQALNIEVMALVQQANYVFHLAKELGRCEKSLAEASLTRVYDALRIKKDEMLDALARVGVEIEDPLGQSFEAVADRIEVQGWLHPPDCTVEMVVEVYDPIVTYHGRLAQYGHVVMAAPPEATPDDLSNATEYM
ncbi:MAG TPA: hypothetical protein VKR06_12890 [Ktedonosporobacter sp.]|nr:hypothetical protein [Ktedonosporobacter sp.]